MISKTLPVDIKIVISANIDTRWVCEGEGIFVYQVIIWVHTILNHIDTRAILLRYESSCIIFRPEWYQQKINPSNTSNLLVLKKCEKVITDTQMVSKKDDTSPTLVLTQIMTRVYKGSLIL